MSIAVVLISPCLTNLAMQGSVHDCSTCYTTTEAPVIAHHAKLGGLRLAPKGPAIQGGAPPIKEKKGRGVNWFTYRVAFVRAQTHLHYLQSRSLERGGGH